MDQIFKKFSSSLKLEIPKGNRLIYDWVSFSTRIHKPEQIIELLGMTNCPWEILSGFYGYNFRHCFGGVSIHFCNGDMSHVGGFYLLEMSGQGCRTFETYGHGDYEVLFGLVRSELLKDKKVQNVRLTRLDIAYDDLTGVLDLEQMLDYADHHYFVSRFATRNIEQIAMPGEDGRIAKGLNCGSKVNGLIYIRIYNKALERGFDEKACSELNIPFPFHWVRCELQLRKENAGGFISRVSQSSLSEVYSGVLENYLSFREPPEKEDSNRRRWEESPWWTAFLNNARAISIVDRPGVKYNLTALAHYVQTQPLGSIKTLIRLFGVDGFIDFIRSFPDPKNPKYKRLIAEVEQERARQECLPGDEFTDLGSDDVLIDLAELADERRAELDSIHNHAVEKTKEIARSKLNHRIGSELGTTKQKLERSVWAEEYLRKRGFDLK